MKSKFIAALCILFLVGNLPNLQADQPLVSSIDSVGFTVHDMDRVAKFFTEVLTFEKQAKVDWISPGNIDIVDNELDIDRGLMVAGPSGHHMLIVEESK